MQGDSLVLELALPGQPPRSLGVLLFEAASERLGCRLRPHPEHLAGDELTALWLAHLEADLETQTARLGGPLFLSKLEDSLSNVLRLGERRAVSYRNFEWRLESLYREEVLGLRAEPAKVIPFETHLPLYSLRAAAGRFGEDMEVEPEDWIEIPEGVRPAPDLYAVHVVGHSMEPEIPDGSVVVLRYAPAGTRQNKRVLVWRRASSGEGGEFTLKVYTSRKHITEEDWHRLEIVLRSLNPNYPPIRLEEGTEYRVLGELVRVMPRSHTE